MTHIDVAIFTAVDHAIEMMAGLLGNAAFLLYDQNKSMDEISSYVQKYGLSTEPEAVKRIQFLSNPLYRSYVFTYHVGHDLLEELFTHGDRDQYFARLLAEPVTPSQIREWIKN